MVDGSAEHFGNIEQSAKSYLKEWTPHWNNLFGIYLNVFLLQGVGVGVGGCADVWVGWSEHFFYKKIKITIMWHGIDIVRISNKLNKIWVENDVIVVAFCIKLLFFYLKLKYFEGLSELNRDGVYKKWSVCE